MGTVLLVIIGIVLFFAVLFFLISPSGEKEESAKVGAAFGFNIVLTLMPAAIVIAIIVLIVKSCS